MSALNEFKKGLWAESPVFVLLLGMCPTMATSTTVMNGLGMGIAATFVLLGSNLFVSLLRKVIPDKIRIPCFIVVIATFVTIVDLMMSAYLPDLHKVLGVFVPLIVVNCIILARAEAFAYKNNVLNSVMDGLGMGIGFTLALIILATIREPIATGRILNAPDFGFGGLALFPAKFAAGLISQPVGGFMTLGFVLAAINGLANRKKMRQDAACGCSAPKEV
ncbi:MAG: electron transport complex subunit E [Firmicutes bacterium]|nr:electron transport complex subunit E [Bacillota bacterium]